MTEVVANAINAPTATLTGSVTAGSTSLPVTAPSAPDAWPVTDTFRVLVDLELITVTAASGGATSLSVVSRGVEGTTAASHASASDVNIVLTKAGVKAPEVIAANQIWDAKGDLVAASAADAAARLAVGSNDQVLVADSGQTLGVKWAAVPGTSAFIPVSTIDAKGDLLVGSANDAIDNLAVGTNTHVLTADSTQTLGVKWAAPGGVATDTIWDTKGDLAAATGADAASKLAVGANGLVLTADSTAGTGLAWAAAGASTGGSVKLYDYEVAGTDKATIDTNVDGTTVANFAGYAILEVFMLLRHDGAGAAANPTMTVNNDNSSIYDRQVIAGANTTVTSANALAQDRWTLSCHGSGGLSGQASIIQMLFVAHTGTTFYKSGLMFEPITDSTAANNTMRTSALAYRSTSALTRIKIDAASTNKFKIGSRLIVYGR